MEQIYLVRGRGRLTKIGKTQDWPRRLSALRHQFEKRGDELIQAKLFEPVDDCSRCEFDVMHAMKQAFERHSGFEWFYSDDFDSALAVVEKTVAAQLKKEQYEKSPAGLRELALIAAERQAWIDKRDAFKAEMRRHQEEHRASVALRKEQKAARAAAPIAMVVNFLMAR